jgi:LacI family transcriptional regulator
MRRAKRVIVITHGQGQYGHDTALGIIQFSAHVGHWDTLLELAGGNIACIRSAQRGIREWKADAIVGELLHKPLMDEIRRSGIHAVNVSIQSLTDMPTVCCDHSEIGRLAVRHFIERHYRSFAFCGRPKCEYSRLQEQAYREALAHAGFGCAGYPHSKSKARNWLEEYSEIQSWVRRLPRPVAVLACDDIRGRDVLLACERLDIRVPDDLAVLGSVNDTLLCSTCQPPLASVAIPAVEIGYRAAQLAQRLMMGGKPPTQPILVEPSGIVQRRSSDSLAVDDADVVAAANFIRDNCSKPFVVRDLLNVVPVSRRSLERKFRKVLGRTPQAEILRCRLQQAESLLTQTDMKVSSIGRAAGFSGYLQFIRCFRRKSGATPTEYRSRFHRSDFGSIPALTAPGIVKSRKGVAVDALAMATMKAAH